jgi:glycosyltransferase involved in cell wall biosynthesis
MIKIRFIYRNYKRIHSIFLNMIETPPAGVEYVLEPPKQRPIFFFKVYKVFGSVPGVRGIIEFSQRFISKEVEDDSDILYSVDTIIRNNRRKPYIVDIGHFGALANHSGHTKSSLERSFKFLNSNDCKAIIFRSNASRNNAYDMLGNNFKHIKERSSVIYPALNTTVSRKIFNTAKNDKFFKSNTVNLLFVGSELWRKGLAELINALNEINEPDKFMLTVVSNDYNRISSYVAQTVNHKGISDNIKIYPANYTKQELIDKFYLKSHLFVMPSHFEILGMVFLEALSTGSPVIAIDQYSTHEIIQNGKNGYLVKSDKVPLDQHINPMRADISSKLFVDPEIIVVEQLKEYLHSLYNNRQLLKKLSQGAFETVNSKDSTFSMKIRNTKLKNIYEQAIS